jgi:hypothetical protein
MSQERSRAGERVDSRAILSSSLSTFDQPTNAYASSATATSAMNVVSDWLGHENPAFAYAKYGHALKKDTQAAVVKMEGAI